MNPNTPGGNADLAAALAVSRQKIHRTVIARIWELNDGGLDLFEIQSLTGLALPLVRLVLRGAPPNGVKP